MNRKKSLVALIILLFGLFLLGGCGDNTEQGVIEAGGGSVTLAAADTTVAEGNSTILTATVSVIRKDSTGAYITDHYPGQAVTFVIISNNSGGTITPMNGGITNAEGVASAVYTAGKLKKGLVVQDTIQAHIAGYSGQVIITRTGVESGYTIALTATPTSVAAGQNSVITATVTATNPEGGSSVPVSGQFVSFSFVSNNSGGSLVPVNGVTDAAGKATATYSAGSGNVNMTVTDTIQASSGGSTSAVTIERTGEGTSQDETKPLGIKVAATPTEVNPSGISVIFATLSGDNKTGVSVSFSIPTNNSGATLSASSAISDGEGKATVTYRAGSNNPTVAVQDTVQASVGSIKDIVLISRTGTSLTSYTLQLTPSTSDFLGGWTGKDVGSILTAKVTNSSGQPVSGLTVTFSIESGGGALSSATAVTNASGEATVSYSRFVAEPAGTEIFVFFKARLPDGTETLAVIRIEA